MFKIVHLHAKNLSARIILKKGFTRVIGMFKLGDYVVNSTNGVCKIEEIQSLNLTGENKDYYLLIPPDDISARTFVPVDRAQGRIRPVMDKDHAMELIGQVKALDEVYVEIEKQRDLAYKQAVNSNSPQKLASVYKTTYRRKQGRLIAGKKPNSVDERYLKKAEDLLYNELCFVLQLSKKEVAELLLTNI